VKPDSIVFDLDGTLWDTCNACATAWNNVLSHLNISYRPINADDVRAVTGRPHEECIRQTFSDLTEEQVLKISEETMAEDNAVIEEMGGQLYPGVLDDIPKLAKQYNLFIVSNCQSGYIETFLRLNNLSMHFHDIECWGNTGQPKSANLKSIIERNSLENPVMVGDTDGDEKAARDCGVQFAFAAYGFGQVQSSDLAFESFSELVNHFNSL
jgi:phosphoglycolate phosphatase